MIKAFEGAFPLSELARTRYERGTVERFQSKRRHTERFRHLDTAPLLPSSNDRAKEIPWSSSGVIQIEA